MNAMFLHTFLAALLAVPCLGSHEATWIPRAASGAFRSEGYFEGGADSRATLARLRVAPHKGFERWVLDFSDTSTAPRFRLEYQPADKWLDDEGKAHFRRPARFLLRLRKVDRSRVRPADLRRLAAKSPLVKEVILYPAIEDGDRALEIVLESDVLFEPHQPQPNEARLVLDLKASGG